MRKSTLFTLLTSVNILLVALIALHARHSQGAAAGVSSERAGLVRSLRLTDLCLFTEARYTRHPSLADLHSAAQDHPLSLEHFPSGSLMPPPAHLRNHAPLDRQTTLPD
jgi:hypothetical protein